MPASRFRSLASAAALGGLALVLNGCGGGGGGGDGGDKVVSGSGAWRYQYEKDLVKLPAPQAMNDQHGHGLCKDPEGNIYFTFVPKVVTNDTQVLVRFKPDGTGGELLGKPGPEGLSNGVPHGLRFEHDPVRNESYLYHANNDATVMKTTLDGRVIWTANFTGWADKASEFHGYWPYRPTDAIVVPGTDILLVADGYGSSFVHSLNKTNGAFMGKDHTFGGVGNTTAPLRLHTPHGINLDPAMKGAFVISDRSNSRMVWVTANGTFLRSSSTAAVAGMSLPCNADVLHDSKAGFVSVVPSLGTKDLTDGSVAIYSADNSLLSVLEVSKLLGAQGHQNPHDAMFLPNGDVVVCCWAGPGNKEQGPANGTISYWRRLPGDGQEVSLVI